MKTVRLGLPTRALGFVSETRWEPDVEKSDYSLFLTKPKPVPQPKNYTSTESVEDFLKRGGKISTPKNNWNKSRPERVAEVKQVSQDLKAHAMRAWFKNYQAK